MKRSAYVTGVALLALVACSTEGKTEVGAEGGTKGDTKGDTGKQAPTDPLPSPYTAKELKAALLTTAQTPSGFEVYRTAATEPSSPPADVSEKVRPEECAVLRNPDTKARAETVVATAQLYRPSDELDQHSMALVSWAESDAKVRMAALRSALGKCRAIQFENINSNGTREAVFQAEKGPELGDETLRYSLNSPSFYQGFTVVRVQGVITYVKSETVFGMGLTDQQREELTPEPQEQLIRAQVAEVERTLR
ncbi:hypothetical protein EJ357_21220 [Streptomyces cyaneochromogenes]|uniref:Sensor domain-containing protein n=1 Tax=Streptomyces cyaneochromogenes TaxID=2496836 RepID=A0A3Q9EU25_9ACTN|nr:hypothetical protein [Streptomyces cyaneochromogenes]AZQ35706.1 hypothetical protein EJ357_21220 [Streptomyces cyaneochromogenes]